MNKKPIEGELKFPGDSLKLLVLAIERMTLEQCSTDNPPEEDKEVV